MPLDPRDPLFNAHAVTEKLQQERLRERWFGSDYGLLAFAWEAVLTKDDHDHENPLKRLPREAYLEDHFRNFLREPTYFILKSRQIMITWATFIALLWECLRYRYCTIALVPKKEEDGDTHIEDRIRRTLWPSLPPWIRSDFTFAEAAGKFWLKSRRNVGTWDSWIVAFAKGENQLRMHVHSRIFWDEMAFQELARRTYGAAMATVGSRGQHSGRVVCNSTFAENSFHDELMGNHKLQDPRLVDKAVAVALMEQEPDHEVKRPMIGVAHYRNPTYGAFCAVYSFLADSEKRDPAWEKRDSIRVGGADTPEWLTEYRMRRGARKGVVVFPHFDVRWNVVPVRPVNKECEIFLAMDFGHTAPNAILFCEWDRVRRVLTVFDEIYATGTAVSTFKIQIAAKLCAHLKIAPDELVFSERLGDNVGDPEDPGTMLEYAQEPWSLNLRGNPPGQNGWKVNNRRLGEYRLDSALRPGLIRCGQRQFPLDGETKGACQVLAQQPDGTWRECGREHEAEPMFVIMSGRAPNLVREVPIQVRIDVADPLLETPEKSKRVADHATSAAKYAVMRYPNFLAIDVEDEPKPAYLTAPVEKLTGNQSFWREYHETFEANKARQEEQHGEIGYDADGEDDSPADGDDAADFYV